MDRGTGEFTLGRNNDGVTVIVGTLDIYAAAWPVLCHSFQRFWPDCPWRIRFITNFLDAPCGKAIKVGGDHTDWSGRMRKGLKRIRTPIILWLTGDNWLTAPPDVKAIRDFANLIKLGHIDHCRLYPGWNLDRSKGTCPHDSRLLVFTRKSPYRCSLKPGLWRTSTFLELLKDGESPWDFEKGSARSRKYGDRFVATRDWYLSFVTNGCPDGHDWQKSPLVRGRWTKSAKRYCEREDLKVNFGKHPVDGLKSTTDS